MLQAEAGDFMKRAALDAKAAGDGKVACSMTTIEIPDGRKKLPCHLSGPAPKLLYGALNQGSGKGAVFTYDSF